MRRIWLIPFLTCLMPPASLNAIEIEDLSHATHVVIGKLKTVYMKKFKASPDEPLYTGYVLAMEVHDVEKGPGLPVGNTLYVPVMRLIRQPPAAVGFLPTPAIPSEGDTIRLFLYHFPENDGTFHFVGNPRAIELLKHAQPNLTPRNTPTNRAVNEFVQGGGWAAWVDEGERHLIIKRLGVDEHRYPLSSLPALKDVRRLTLRGRGFHDVDLEALPAWTDLQSLDLIYGSVTDAGMKYIARLTNLRRLLLWGTKITGAGLAQLTALEHLEFLEIQDSPLSGTDLQALTQLRGLRVLRLLGTHVTSQGLKKLHVGLPRCRIEAD